MSKFELNKAENSAIKEEESESQYDRPIIVIDVTLGPSHSSKLTIKESDKDNVEYVVEDFSSQHSLSPLKKDKLLQVVLKHRDTYM